MVSTKRSFYQTTAPTKGKKMKDVFNVLGLTIFSLFLFIATAKRSNYIVGIANGSVKVNRTIGSN